ncbi:HAMP domain-containing histidine kinase [Candidatus Saccharibacteria bacterium]|nr:HAMP domain-containing histidine kinase [Candidatus Saccharibacteria bacterium]
MFKKLRNKFIIINLITTTFILLVAYSAVYISAANSATNRKPFPNEFGIEIAEDGDTNFRSVVEERIFADRKLALNNLLVVLIITGLSVELLVLFFSYVYAEEAIKPVKEAYETQKIFIANASHEIKTPIAAIKANLEAADLSEKNHWIKNIELEADKIETLNLALLKLAKTDAVKEAVTIQDVKLKPLVLRTINSFEPRITQQNLTLTSDLKIDKDLTIKLNRNDFQELLGILIDNAIKYSKTKIDITLTQKSFKIQNDGATIPKDKLPHILDRFYQVDKSSNGSGLGLAIADSLSKRNNWHLSADSDKTTTTFLLTFN